MRSRCRAGSWIGATLLGVAACGVEVDDNSFAATATTEKPPPGLYTPGNTFGADPNSDGGIAVSQRELTEALLRMSGGKNNCAALPADTGLSKDEADSANANGTAGNRPKTPGMLTISYQTKDQGQRWAPANVGAAWIADPQDRFVRTVELWAAERRGSLGVYNTKACNIPDPDVVTQATLKDHTTRHMGKWDGKDIMGNIVPDGQYVLFIEVAETETMFGPRAQVAFKKGVVSDIQNVADTPATTDLKLEYMPTTQAAPGATTGP